RSSDLVNQVTGFVFGCQFHELVGYDYTDGQRLDADLLIHVDFLAIKEFFDIRMEDVEVHRSGPRPLAQLVGIREGIFEDFHDGQYTTGASFHAFYGFTTSADF